MTSPKADATAELPPRKIALALFLASCAALFVELMLIRWESAEIPILSYFKNFPLLAAFIGLGTGSLLARYPTKYWQSSLWTLGGLCVVITLTETLTLDRLIFPDPNIDVWSRDVNLVWNQALRVTLLNLACIFLLFAATTWSFVGIGQAIGHWLQCGPPLKMYSIDIMGSLAGTLLFSLLAYFSTPPQVWLVFSVILLGLAGLFWNGNDRRSYWPLIGLFIAAVAVWQGSTNLQQIVRWSPYYRIEVYEVENEIRHYGLNVNRDIHQWMMDFSMKNGETMEPNSPARTEWEHYRKYYCFPYYFKPNPDSVLIGGAGTGNDVAGAVVNGARKVTAVEIDPEILDIGKTMHPLRPYDSPVVHKVNTDIRSFLRRNDERFDVIVYGILDSHTALSALSSLRLENYVYTVEGIRDAVNHLTPDGIMTLSFVEGNRKWLGRRLYENIQQATGERPELTKFGGTVFFVFGPGLSNEAARKVIRDMDCVPLGDEYGDAQVKPSTDDWPFLYTNPRGQPLVYYVSLVLVVVLGATFVYQAVKRTNPAKRFSMDWHMFFLGAGFLLIETKGLAEMSLLFGSTWIVNTFVFACVFVMVLLANLAVHKGAGRHFTLAYVLLVASLVSWYFFPRATLNAFSFAPRAAIGSALVVVPLLFAGIVFATSFSRTSAPHFAFGSNLIGAVVGGTMEAASLTWGIRALTLIGLAFYIASWISLRFSNNANETDSN